MTIKDFWELNIRGNAAQQLRALAQTGTKAAASFNKGSHALRAYAPAGNRATKSVGQLEYQLAKLQQRQKTAFDPRHIKRYNIMIDQTRAKIARMEAMGRKASMRRGMGMGFGGMSPLSFLLPYGVAGGLAMGGISLAKGAMTNTIMPFSKEMSRVQAVSGASLSEKKQLEQRAIEVAAGTPFTPTEAARGERYMAMAGWKKHQIMMGLPSVANLSMAGDVDMGRSADILSNVMGQFGLGASRTADTANTLSALISTSNTNLEQSAEAYKYLGPSLKAFNVSLQETGALIGTLADSGVQGSLAGRALGTSITRLAKPTNKMQESLDALSIKTFDAHGRFVGLKNLIGQLESATKNLTDEEKQRHIQTIFGAEAIQEINILLERGSEEFGKYAESLNANNKAAEMARVQSNNLSTDIAKLNSAWDQFILALDNGHGTLSKLTRTITQWGAASLSKAAVREKFGAYEPMGAMGRANVGGGGSDFLVDQYMGLNKKFMGISTYGGSAEEQIAKLKQLQQEVVSGGIYSKDLNSSELKKSRFLMVKDLSDRIRGSISALKEDDTLKTSSGKEGRTDPALTGAVDSINSGGRRVRNVIVNIDKLVENMVNHVGSLKEGDTGTIEEDGIGLLLRVINGAEQAMINGEY